jgi:hypothetical protein
LVYEALKNGLPFSKDFIKNKRVFNENDVAIFRFYKNNGLEKTHLQYGAVSATKQSNTVNREEKTVLKLFEATEKTNNENFKKSLLTELETVKKQFLDKEKSLKAELEQKDKIISIKEEQTQKYALLKTEEQHEKQDWIKKYEVINQEKNDWVKKFYALKAYFFVAVVLFSISAILLTFLAIKLL